MKKSILVVDDHESIRMLMSNFLKADYHVITKQDGLEALAWLSRGNIPQLIILDMSLPNISGIEFLTNIRSSGFFGQIPVIVVSGSEGKDLKDKCHQLGIADYLVKPFNPMELQTKIKITIDNKQAVAK